MGALAGCSGPPHERRDPPYDGADPGVEDVHAFQRRVAPCVEDDVCETEEGGGGVDAVVEGACTEDTACDSEDGGATGADEFPDEGAIPGSAHFSVVLGFHEHVEGVGRGGTQRCAGGEEEEGECGERGGGCCGGGEEPGDGVEGVSGCGGEDDEEGETGFGEGEVSGEEAFEGPLGELGG